MNITPKEIEAYCITHSSPFSPVYAELREKTYAELSAPNMQVGALEGNFLKLLVRISGAKNILEFGTFSGFSSLCFAEALPQEGKIITCDIDPRASSIAKEFWAKAGLAHKVDFRLGPGLETLKELADDSIDIIFIDADKANYWNYFQESFRILKKGGFYLVDNVLWSGRVLNPQEKSDHQIHEFNEKVKGDPRVEIALLPIRDGVSIIRKK